MEYLHERCNPPVIHRDLKSSNILLDSNFNAKVTWYGIMIYVSEFGSCSNNESLRIRQHIYCLVQLSDFGLAITGGNSNKTNIKLSGTLGYVAPEYLLDGKEHFCILNCMAWNSNLWCPICFHSCAVLLLLWSPYTISFKGKHLVVEKFFLLLFPSENKWWNTIKSVLLSECCCNLSL